MESVESIAANVSQLQIGDTAAAPLGPYQRGDDGMIDIPAGRMQPADAVTNFASLVRQRVDLAQVSTGIVGLRRLLSMERDPPIDSVIESGLVPSLMGFLEDPSFEAQLKFETMWVLTNIASGTGAHVDYLVRQGLVPVVLRVLQATQHQDLLEQAIWCLGNIAGDNVRHRDTVLAAGALPILVAAIERADTRISILRNGVWTLSNLCRGKPAPEWTLVRNAVPVLSRVLYSPDQEVITDCLWALSYLTDGQDDRIEAVVQAGVVRRVVELMANGSVAVVTPALRTIGNIVTGNDQQAQVCLNAGVLHVVPSLLGNTRKAIRKEACWLVSNLTAGTIDQIQAVIDAGIISRLVQVAEKDNDRDVRKEAAWALSNGTVQGNDVQVQHLVSLGVINALGTVMSQLQDNRTTQVCLEGLQSLIRHATADQKRQLYNDHAETIERALDSGIDIAGNVLDTLSEFAEEDDGQPRQPTAAQAAAAAAQDDGDVDDAIEIDEDAPVF